jgi:putative restriction endonuclease
MRNDGPQDYQRRWPARGGGCSHSTSFDAGPDSVRNGLALCGTIHWMFDRGLLSLADDLTILMAESRVPETVKRLINPERKLLFPGRADFRPHPQFLRFHREAVFKG